MRFALLIIILSPWLALAQPTSMQTKKHPYKWMIGLSWSAIDDNGHPFDLLFDVNGSWNYEYFPTRLSIDRFINKYGWSFEGAASFNRYFSNKLINDTTGFSGFLINAETSMKYSFRNLMGRTKWLEPYIALGVGGTHRTIGDIPIALSLNTNLGCNIWFKYKWGIQIQSSGKIGLLPELYETNTNYMQHTIGLVYRYTPKKRSQSTFDKRQYKWVHEKRRFNRKNT